MFQDRTDAGKQLGQRLSGLNAVNPIVLGILRGGAGVGYQVAQILNAEYSVIAVGKLPFPDNRESGFGAVAEDGSLFILPGLADSLPTEEVELIIRRQRAEVTRKVAIIRDGTPLPPLENRHVILVDDGIAMGSTAHAAVTCCRKQGARHVTLAAPVASAEARTVLSAVADDIVVVLTPPAFLAVAEFYRQWHDVTDREVMEIMKAARQSGMMSAA